MQRIATMYSLYSLPSPPGHESGRDYARYAGYGERKPYKHFQRDAKNVKFLITNANKKTRQNRCRSQ